MNPAGLLFPAPRFDQGDYEDRLRVQGLEAVALGVGGFIVFGGDAATIHRLIADLRAASDHSLLFGADLERGCGQQFDGATRLPPPAAIAHLDDLEAFTFAGSVTGREARLLGIDWVFAPVADLDIEPRNPIVGTRAFGRDPEQVASRIVAWIRGCRAAGALTCVKHFPGHGRTVSDSHVGLPTVAASRTDLEDDLRPFRAAIEAGVESVMTAHVHYPELDSVVGPATRSARIVSKLLREHLGFEGVVVTDALIMAGAGPATGEGEAAVKAVAAGVDALLYPHDAPSVGGALQKAVDSGQLPADRVEEALGRLRRMARSLPVRAFADDVALRSDQARAESLAMRTLQWTLSTNEARLTHSGARLYGQESIDVGSSVHLVTVDDDVGGPFPSPPRAVLPSVLMECGIHVVEEAGRQRNGAGEGEFSWTVFALYSESRGWKGRSGLGAASVSTLREAIEDARAAGRRVAILLFGHPRLLAEVPPDIPTLLCWSGEPIMQRAAANCLAARSASSEASTQ